MWDDSEDSMSSPSPDAKKNTGKPSYSYPTSFGNNRKGKNSNRSSQDDIDQLFGDSTDFSQTNSPADRRNNERVIPDYSMPETTTSKPNYLANFTASSHDFEDSILGELLGGTGVSQKPSKASIPDSPLERSTSPAGAISKFDPLEDSTNSAIKPPKSLSKHASAPILSPTRRDNGMGNDNSSGGGVSIRPLAPSQRSQSFRFATELDSADSSPVKPLYKANKGKANDDSIERIPEPILPMTKSHHNSFDMDVMMESSSDFNRPTAKTAGFMPNLSTSRDSYEPTSGNMGVKSFANSNAPITTKSLDRGSLPAMDALERKNSNSHEEDEDAGINFVPSFLDPGRQGRRRRQLDRPSTTGGIDNSNHKSQVGSNNNGGSKLDELDAILGFGSGPKANEAKVIVDPFAAVEKRTLPKPTMTFDSDSSSDDGIFRSKPKKKDSFFNKPTATTSNTSSQSTSATANNANTVNTTPNNNITDKDDHQKDNDYGSTHLSHNSSIITNNSNNKARPSSAVSSALPSLTGHYSNNNNSLLSSPTTSNSNAAVSVPTTPGSGGKRGHRARFDNNINTKDIHNLEDSSELESSTGGILRHSNSSKRDQAMSNSSNPSQKKQSEMNSNPAPSPSPSPVQQPPPQATQQPAQTQAQGQGIQLTRRSVSAASRLSPAKPVSSSFGSSTLPPVSPSSSYDHSNMFTSVNNNSTNNVITGGGLSSRSRDQNDDSRPNSSGGSVKITRFADDILDPPSVNNNANSNNSDGNEISRLADKSRQQKHQNDKRMEEELQQMRQKLEQLSTNTNNNKIFHAINITDDISHEKQLLLEQNLQLQQVQIDSKRVIAALEIELNRLKDELNIQAAKHIDALKHQSQTYEQDILSLKSQHAMEVEVLERRHTESINALKKVHEQEISSWKDRYKGTEIFENITNQMRHTTGSMKFLEEQLQQRHKQVEMMREGQFEAREKILMEMEEKARERAELAEAEGFKLKGILQHMQQMVDAMRNSGIEEKNRLLSEHGRLKTLQDQFEQEKQRFHQRSAEENTMLKLRAQDLEREIVTWNQEKIVQLEQMNAARRKLETEKVELQAYLQAQKSNLETLESTVRDEEKRLQRQREELSQEKFSFEQRKLQASRDLEESDNMKRLLNNAAKKLHQELDAVAVQAQKLQMDQEELVQAQAELLRQREALELREQTLKEGLLEMRQAATSLSTQELQVTSAMRQLEQRKRDLDNLDRDIAHRRVNQAVAFRESLEFQQAATASFDAHPLLTSTTGGTGSNREKENSSLHINISTAHETMGVPVGNASPNDQDMDVPEALLPSPHYSVHRKQHFPNPNTSFAHLPPPPPSSNMGQVHQSQPSQQPQSWTQAFQQQMRNAYVGSAAHNPTAAHHLTGFARPGQVDASVLPDRALPKEVRLAQRTLKDTRLNMQRVSQRSLNTKLTLFNDEVFLKGLRTTNNGTK